MSAHHGSGHKLKSTECERSPVPPELPEGRRLNSKAGTKTISGPPKALFLPVLCQLPDISTVLLLRQECPWDTFWGAMTCDIAGPVIIATHRSRPSRLQAIRCYPATDAEQLVERFRTLHHTNILSTRECYLDESFLYALVDDFPNSLGHLVTSSIFPSEMELGAILTQILAGLAFLSSAGLAHRSLTCNEILLNLDGIIKITCLETCSECSPAESRAQSTAAIPSIAMALMQKQEKGPGVAGVHDVTRWPVNSDAVSFLSAASVAGSIQNLQMHPLVMLRRRPASELIQLARILFVATKVDYTLGISL